jgi:hypothetical protein
MCSMVLIHVVKLNECGNECLGFRALMKFELVDMSCDDQHHTKLESTSHKNEQ